LSRLIFSISFCLAHAISACIALTIHIAAEDVPSGRRPCGGFKCWPAHLMAHIKCFGGGILDLVWLYDESVCCWLSSEYLGSWSCVRAVTTDSSATSSCLTTDGVGTTPLMLSCTYVLLVFWLMGQVHQIDWSRHTRQLNEAIRKCQVEVKQISMTPYPFFSRNIANSQDHCIH
jgi:hypothetical protein